MDAVSCFEEWRANNSAEHSWGLTWFLANEVCKRFYGSHGIVPWVIEHEGLGYYGISLNQLECRVNGKSDGPLGRFTMFGDIENWQIESPGGHDINTIKMCDDGIDTGSLVKATIEHFRFEPQPPKSHLHCRHKRWGDSYKLCFELATIIALRYEDQVQIFNHPFHTQRAIDDGDPKRGMKEHPGAFIFQGPKKTIVITGDARVLEHSGINLWVRFMLGDTKADLVDYIARSIGIQKLPDLQEITRVVSYLPKLYPSEPVDYGTLSSLQPGSDGAVSFSHFDYSADVTRFFQAISADCWTDQEYEPERVEMLLEQPNYIEQANLEELVTLLTYCERGEKYCDGHWINMLEMQYVKRILTRMASLYNIGKNIGVESAQAMKKA